MKSRTMDRDWLYWLALMTFPAVSIAGMDVPQFTVTRILESGTPGSYYATGLNDTGAAVGEVDDGAGKISGFLYMHGAFTDIGSLGAGGTVPLYIGNAGQVVGYSLAPVGNTVLQTAFLYVNGAMTALPGLPFAGSCTACGSVDAMAVNATGEIVGSSLIPLGDGTTGTHATLWSGGTPQDLTPNLGVGAFSTGYALDAAGQAAITEEGAPANVLIAGRELPLYPQSFPTAMNSGGATVGAGTFTEFGIQQAFLYEAGRTVNLGPAITQAIPGTISSIAYGINASGSIVGTALPYGLQTCCDGKNSVDVSATAFLYYHGTAYELNALVIGSKAQRVNLLSATAVNAAGQIVANGIERGGDSTVVGAYLLTPVR